MRPQDLLDSFVQPLQRTRRSGGGYTASCPVSGHANGDRNPSLKVYVGDHRILTHCYSQMGHTWEAVYDALGYHHDQYRLDVDDDRPAILDTYDYRNADGEVVYQVVRMVPKSFRQRKPDGHGDWDWKLGDVERVIYNLPEVLAETERVIVVEGEKDADTLTELGYVATTGLGGAQNWRDEWADSLAHVAEVLVLPDSDDQGARYASKVKRSLTNRNVTVRIIPLGDHKDVSALCFAAGDHASEQVAALIEGGGIEVEAISQPTEWMPKRTADSWMFSHSDGIEMLITQITPSSRGLHAWVEIRWRGAAPAPGLVTAARYDLMGSRTVGSLVARIKEAGIDPREPDWRHLIQQAVYDVIQDYLSGPEAVDLSSVTPNRPSFVLRPLIGGVGATSVIGAGGVGKSLLALACAAAVASGDDAWIGMRVMTSGPVFYVDWEADADTHAERLHALEAGTGLTVPPGQLSYIDAEAPLTMWAPALARRIARADARLVIIDSVMLARGGEAAAAETISFFAALRSLGCPSLLVDHQSREALENNRTGAYGSIINDNTARLRWIIRGDRKAISIKNVKANNFGKLPNINLTLDATVKGERLDAARWVHIDPPPPSGGLTEQVLQVINDHPTGLTPVGIGKILDRDANSFRKVLYRLAERGMAQQLDGEWYPMEAPY